MLCADWTWAAESRFVRVILGLLLLAICASAGAAEAPAADPATHLVGTVLDASGKPATGAVVGILVNRDVLLMRSRSINPLYVTTDAAGRFELSIPRALGAVTVVARRAGSLSVRSKSIPLEAPRQEVPALMLGAGLKLTGRVLDEQRRPIAAASVEAVAEDSQSDTIRVLADSVRAQTQRDGSFELAGLDAGAFTLGAYGKSHALWTRPKYQVAASAGSRHLEIVLKKGVYLAGKVLDLQGRPIAGVTVSTSQFSSLTGAKSDASGRFRIGPFAAGQRHSIDARLAGYTPFREYFAAPRTDLALVLNRNAVLRGRVIDASDNQPLQSFQVKVHNYKGVHAELPPDGGRPRAFNSRDGRFELPNLYTGPWTITVLARGYLGWEIEDFELQSGVTHDLAITLTKGLTLRGRVIDRASGRPLPGARVSYELKPRFLDVNTASPPPALSDATGTFALEGLPPGPVKIRASVRGYREAAANVDVDSQTFVELAVLRGATIRGQVVAADGVTPAQATVMLYTQPKNGQGRASDAQGRFEFTQEAAGHYWLEAKTESARSELQEVTVTDGQDLADVVLRLAAAATVRGRVSGVPAAELATVKVAATDSGVERFERMFSLPLTHGSNAAIDTGGAYRLQGLDGGPTLISVRSRLGSIVKQAEVPERGETTLDFDFGDVQVSGRVTRDGRPAPGVGVYARPLEGQRVFALATTTPTGEYALSNLARGRYSVGAYNAKAVEIQVGNGVVQNFDLGTELEISGRAVDATTGQGLAEVASQLVALTPAGASIDLLGMLRSNRQGEFKLSQVKPGEYRLILYRAGYDIAEQRVSVGASVTGLVIGLRAAEGVPLRVRTAEPIGGVGVYEAIGEDALHLSLKLDQYGTAKLPPSLAGRTFKIQHGDYVPHSVQTWNGAPLDIELRPLETR